MERKRKQKILMIIVLIISIASVSIGFAAFSKTLTISSSAKVTPTDDGFMLNMYGFTGETEADTYLLDKYNSETSVNMLMLDLENGIVLYSKKATINNSSLSLDLGKVEFTGPNMFVAPIMIKNEGEYDAFLDTSKISTRVAGICEANSGTSESLVSEACSTIFVEVRLETEDTFLLAKEANDGNISWNEYYEAEAQDCFYSSSGVCKLEKGGCVFAAVVINYMADDDFFETPLVDGPFTVSFPDIKLEFTTDSTGYVED